MRNTRLLVLMIFGTLFLTASLTAQVVFKPLADDEVKILDGLSGLLSRTPQAIEVEQVRKAAQWPSPIVRCLATVLLKKWGDTSADRLLLEHFSVNDYVERSKGVQHLITPDQMIEAVKAAEVSCKALKANGAIMLVLYNHFRNKNQWMPDPAGTGQNIEMARFFRTAYFAGVFKGTSIDAVKTSMMIDIATRKASGVK
ncbi:MAG TPA: hypothetical protein PKO06_05225 [Candidatus Ozemobacteraceae bacterium]|nr:hypothetical protein [Candidatus Ozemobacteraceae bacterium]